MSVPNRKLSKRRTRMRAAHHALSVRMLTACDRCNTLRPSHRVCPKCGYYAGREVIAKED